MFNNPATQSLLAKDEDSDPRPAANVPTVCSEANVVSRTVFEGSESRAVNLGVRAPFRNIISCHVLRQPNSSKKLGETLGTLALTPLLAW